MISVPPSLLAASALPTAHLLVPFLWVFGLASVLVAFLHSRKLPSILGFLLTGVILGPVGLGVVQNEQAIDIMAEVGIVLLMFTIGLEVSIRDLMRMGRLVLGGGTFQIAVTSALFAGVALLSGVSVTTAISIGLLCSASSTALVLRMLGDRGELAMPHGQFSLAILLAQDFAVVALMLVLPMLADGGFSIGVLAFGLGEGVVLAGLIVVVARTIFPWILAKVVELRSREVFMLATFATVFGTAFVGELLGLSLALGAFLAGIVVSESDFSHQMFAEVLPFRDIFNGLFFASVGLLIDPEAVMNNIGMLLAFLALIWVGKGIIFFGTAKLFKLSTASAILSAFALSQLGEFGLVLAQQAASLELLSGEERSIIITAAVVTMGATSIILPWATSRWSTDKSSAELPDEEFHLTDHVIVVGFGLNGQNVTKVLKRLGVPYVVVEMNQATVAQQKATGEPIVFGDATRPTLLEHLHVGKARALVSAIAGAASTREIIASAHHANPEMLIIARTRYVAEIDPLIELGADVVVPEEFETSIELASRVMQAYGASEVAIQRERRAMRDERYKSLTDAAFQGTHASMDELLAALDMATVQISEGSRAVGQTLSALDFRAQTGATVVAIHRHDEIVSDPNADTVLSIGDRLVVIGDSKCLKSVRELGSDPTFAAIVGEQGNGE